MDTGLENLIKKGIELLDNGKYEDALSYFDQALVLDSKDPDLWNKKGVALRSLGRYEEAIECFNKSLSIEARDLDAS